MPMRQTAAVASITLALAALNATAGDTARNEKQPAESPGTLALRRRSPVNTGKIPPDST